MPLPNHLQFSVSLKFDDFLMRDHRVHQTRIMPGVTFIDMILRYLVAKGVPQASISLRKILFLEPIAVAEVHDKLARLSFEKREGYWAVSAKSRKVKNGRALSPDWDENMHCEVHLVEETPPHKVPLAKRLKQAQQVTDLDTIYEVARSVQIEHFEFMKGLGKVFHGSDCLIAEIHLSDLAQSYLKKFLLHPAYLDAATVAFLLLQDPAKARQFPYIPLFIKEFRAWGKLGERIWVHISKEKAQFPSADLMVGHIDLCDENGVVLAQFDPLHYKRIRHQGLITRLKDTSATTAVATEPAPQSVQGNLAANDRGDAFLTQLLAEVTNKTAEEIGWDSGFFDQGFASTDLLNMVHKLEQRLEVSLYPTLLFEHTSLADLATYFADQHPGLLPRTLTAAQPGSDTNQDLEAQLLTLLADLLNRAPETFSLEQGFYEQGLASTDLLDLVRAIETQFKLELYPTLLFEQTTLKSLAQYLRQEFPTIAAQPAKPTPTTAQVQPSETFFASSSWVDQPLQANPSSIRQLLLFTDDDALGAALEQQLGPQRLVWVKKADDYAQISARHFQMRPGHAGDIAKLFDALEQTGPLPQHLLMCWNKQAFATDVDLYLAAGYANLLHVSQAYLSRKTTDPIQLCLASTSQNDSLPITAFAGFAASLARENPRFQYRMVSLQPQPATSLATSLIEEFSHVQVGTGCVRFVPHRQVQRLEFLADDPQRPLELNLDSEAVCLVTGGLGGLGFLFCKFLAKAFKARLMLCGRRKLDSGLKARLRVLEELGAQVAYTSLNLENKAAVNAWVEQINQDFGSIQAVFHAAGCTRDSFVITKDPLTAGAVFAPKIHGLLHLDEATQNQPLRFFLPFSSTAAWLGISGQSDYAFANRFMDDFCAARNRKQRKGLRTGLACSLNWPLWQEGGMQVDSATEKGFFQRFGLQTLPSNAGLQAFVKVVGSGKDHVLVLHGDAKAIQAKLPGQYQPLAPPVEPGNHRSTITAVSENEDIAIVGLAGRYPQAPDLEQFWQNLTQGKDCIETVPPERWNHEAYFSEKRGEKGKVYAKWGGFLKDIDCFDALLFNITPKEAQLLDPQERLFLEVVWETFERAGRLPVFEPATGVFVGVMWNQYQILGAQASRTDHAVVANFSAASIANRISYQFNFNGPCMALDTMCSSSLTAIVQACDSLRKGDCNQAIAGGVNLSLHPSKYQYLSHFNMLSSDGRCRSFGAGGDGYVPGEGVGAVLLKPLGAARQDRDRIFGVIKAGFLNHGGRASGFTVPNPKAQTELIREGLRRAGIAGNTLGYIETHGTGTSLGDPIEIRSLANGLALDQDSPSQIAMGSVKSNIGHLEAAAGVAGVTKVILQMQHQTLVPSLHSSKTNPNISFEQLPFELQQQKQAWPKPPEGQGMRAAISSFGAGGTNAFMVLESAPPAQEAPSSNHPGPWLLPISARNQPQLIAYAKRYLQWLEHPSAPDAEGLSPAKLREAISACMTVADETIDLEQDWIDFGLDRLQMAQLQSGLMPHLNGVQAIDWNAKPSHLLESQASIPTSMDLSALTFTAQVGRQPLPCRLALVLTGYEDLVNGLKAFVSGESRDFVFSGTAQRHKKPQSLTWTNTRTQQALQQLAQSWVQGGSMDWLKFARANHSQSTPIPIDIPTYPFERQRHWLAQTAQPSKRSSISRRRDFGAFRLEPQNQNPEAFEIHVDASHPAIAQHVFEGEAILPGVLYLEMAWQAGRFLQPKSLLELKDWVWWQPFEPNHADQSLGLRCLENLDQQTRSFELFSQTKHQRIRHATGSWHFPKTQSKPSQLPELTEAGEHVSAETLYARLGTTGLEYGTAFQVVTACRVAQHAMETLVVDTGQDIHPDMKIHPFLADGALHALAAMLTPDQAQKGFLPYALEGLQIFGDLRKTAAVRVEKSTHLASNLEVTITLCDAERNPLAIFDRLTLRATHLPKSDPISTDQKMLFVLPTWNDIALQPSETPPNKVWRFTSRSNNSTAGEVQVICDQPTGETVATGHTMHGSTQADFASMAQTLFQRHGYPQRIVFEIAAQALSDTAKALTSMLQAGPHRLLAAVQGFANAFKGEFHQPVPLVVVCGETVAGPCVTALAAMARSLNLEQHFLSISILETHLDTVSSEPWLAREFEDPCHIRFTPATVQKWTLRETQEPAAGEITLKKGGTYLISGGMGGLGQVLARYLAETYQANLMLCGRSKPSQKSRDFCKTLEGFGATASYTAVNLAKAKATATWVTQTQKLDGVFHTAGILRDKRFDKKTAADLKAVFAPKVYGLVNLDLATRDYELDFFIAFSSSTALTGNPGQSDYGAANGFMDGWLSQRQAEGHCGKSLSLNWPFWAAGGMQLGEKQLEHLRKRWGMTPIATRAGLQALEQSLGSSSSQLAIYAGDGEQIRRALNLTHQPARSDRANTRAPEGLHRATSTFLKQAIHQETGLPVDEIGDLVELEAFGIDSVMILNLTTILEASFGKLSKTLFFQYQTLDALTDYFTRSHGETLVAILGLDSEPTEASAVTTPQAVDSSKTTQKMPSAKPTTANPENGQEPVAVIGMAGRYPQAPDLDIFWENLKAGRDSIEEVPAKRWDHTHYFHEDPDQPNRTYAKWGGFLEDIEAFDPLFFNIAPSEAALMDPQERLFLETAWHVLEDAGYTRADLKGLDVGVFVGVMWGQYQMLYDESAEGIVAPHASYASIANRVSYAFNLSGPSMAVDTMCSSSLTALHLALGAMARGECQTAIVGGVNLMVHPAKYMQLARDSFAARDGRCRSFGKGGSGYVPGEGVGAVLLKPLNQALADGDRIEGVLLGSAINHGGKTHSYTVPNPNAQAKLIAKALENSGIHPNTITYVEAHGTGTSLGDPIEINGLTQAFGDVDEKPWCSIGSVKSNMGHLESAAGIAGLTKVLLQMRHRTLVPSLHSDSLNPHIEFDQTPFQVQQTLTEWQPVDSNPLRAGLSSFGAGGGNAHIILEAGPNIARPTYQPGKQLVPLSAHTANALAELCAALVTRLKRQSQAGDLPDLDDIAHTLQVGREAMKHRLIVMADTTLGLCESLAKWLETGSHPQVQATELERGDSSQSLLGSEPEDRDYVAALWKNQKWSRLSKLWLQGVALDWRQKPQQRSPQKISLPHFPFERRVCWVHNDPSQPLFRQRQAGRAILHPLVHENLSDLTAQKYRSELPENTPLLQEHRFQKRSLMPASGLIEMAFAAATMAMPEPPTAMVNFEIVEAMRLAKDQQHLPVAIQLEPSGRRVHCHLQNELNGSLFARAIFETTSTQKPEVPRLDVVWQQQEEGAALYQRFDQLDLNYGEAFQVIDRVSWNQDWVRASLSLKRTDASSAYLLNPFLLDGAVQAVMPLLYEAAMAQHQRFLPTRIKKFDFVTALPDRIQVLVQRKSKPNQPSPEFNVFLQTETGELCACAWGLGFEALQTRRKQIPTTSKKVLATQPQAPQDLKLVAQTYLQKVIAAEISLAPGDLNPTTPLEDYGLESSLIIKLARKLSSTFGEVPTTVFYEHQTLASLADYFLQHYAKQFQEITSPERLPEAEAPPKPKKPGPVAARQRFLTQGESQERIAIIGLAGRYPQADNLDTFWQNLRQGKDCIEQIPRERWSHESYYDTDPSKRYKTHARWGGFLKDIDAFDPLFFNMSPLDAKLADPQERLFLETIWHCMEDAGYRREDCAQANAGVFAGVMWGQYQLVGANALTKGEGFAGGASYASIANRVSYALNLGGPSMAIDTMCSSSLVAIYLACQALQRGDCDMAFAGGVNLSLHPNKYLQLSVGHFLSSDGRCRAFGSGGDGYVPGEGVGAVLLKPLAAAQRDGDQVLATICGAAMNHGGKTNGYTVPNPKAQSALIQKALERSGWEPSSIDYIEAHGTGTALGDPIEIRALTQAMALEPNDSSSFAIGSVKSNVGHLEAAAGIAGLTKVLLQMRHGELVPSLHSQPANPQIDFHAFHVPQTVEPWPGHDKAGKPRRAAMSAFGAGGSNAHLLVEAYEPEARAASQTSSPQLIVFTAKTHDQLTRLLSAWQAWIGDGKKLANTTLRDMAFTSQVGREHFGERLAMVVEKGSELGELLEKVKNGKRDDRIWRGSFRKQTQTPEVWQAESQAAAQALADLKAGDLTAVANAWVTGCDIAFQTYWQGLESDHRRLSLPKYPFAKERYWITQTQPSHPLIPSPQSQHHDPELSSFLHHNTSTLHAQAYQTNFQAVDLFLDQHQVNQKGVLPGSVMVAMALAAGSHAMQEDALAIRELDLLIPVVVTQATSLTTQLQPDAHGVTFQILGGADNRIVHARGRLLWERPEATHNSIDFERIKAATSRHLSAQTCYQAFRDAGFNYGPAFQTLQQVWAGHSEGLAELRIKDLHEDHRLPIFLDTMLQASIACLVHQDQSFIPHKVGQFTQFEALPDNMFVWIQRSESEGLAPKLNLSAFAADGTLVAQVIALEMQPFQASATVQPNQDVLHFHNTWQPLTPSPKRLPERLLVINPAGIALPSLATHVIAELRAADQQTTTDSGMSFPMQDQASWQACFEKLQKELILPEHMLWLTPSGADEARKDMVVFRFLAMAKAWLKVAGTQALHCVLLHPEGEAGLFGAAMAGSFASLALEQPQIFACAVGYDPASDPEKLLQGAFHLEREQGHAYRYQAGAWTHLAPQEIAGQSSGWQPRQQSTYLLTGGLGGLGLLFAQWLSRVEGVRLLFAGRTAPTAEKQLLLDQLENQGCSVHFYQTDVADAEQVQCTINTIKKDFGDLHGLFHFAGFYRDGLIQGKSPENLAQVLAPKVAGIRHLDAATQDQPLEIFAIASSLAGFRGNVGQFDYSYANAYLDNFAEYREGLRAKGRRSGVTQSIGWPLWANGAMQVDAATEAWLAESFGIAALQTNDGLQAFAFAMAQPRAPRWFIIGSNNPEKTRTFLGLLPEETASPETATPEMIQAATPEVMTVDGEQLLERTLNYLQKTIAAELHLKPAQMRPDEPLEQYGLESITIIRLTQILEPQFPGLNNNFFFEYTSLQAMAKALVKRYETELVVLLGIGGTTKTLTPKGTTEPTPVALPKPAGKRFFAVPEISPMSEKIAVIGLAGRYPDADDLDSFWQNLKAGRDSVGEIPPSRWDWHPYFDPDKQTRWKTYSRWGSFLDKIDQFDPLFFNIAPREAELIDPQERLFLETVWRLLEDAAYTKMALNQGQVGVFVGVMWQHYQLIGARALQEGRGYAGGSGMASIANRVSYTFDFRGPSLALDTMCSGSLTAIHLACESLRRNESDTAVAGGVNLSVHPNKYLQLATGNFLSTEGKCRAFGEGGDGYVPGEGVGAVLLKRLDDAVRDGDRIYGVVCQSTINHGGKTNGYTVPNPNAQEHLIAETIRKAGWHPQDIGYIEAHGTGTALGDPIEWQGLSNAFRQFGDLERPCAIGSVKSNLGHLEAAAGICGLTKLILQLKHRELVPSLHSEPGNSRIPFNEKLFQVQKQAAPWQPILDEGGNPLPRRAGISGFGAGGANAHILVEEYLPPTKQAPDIAEDEYLLVLSAKSESTLRTYAGELLSALKNEPVIQTVNPSLKGLREVLANTLNVSPADIFEDLPMGELGVDRVSWSHFLAQIPQQATQAASFQPHRSLADHFPSLPQTPLKSQKTPSTIAMADLAFTLQVGRHPLHHRLACVARNLDEFMDQLAGFRDQEEELNRVYYGNAKTDKTGYLMYGSDGEAFIAALIEKRHLDKCAHLWVSGADLDWETFYHATGKPKRISLPGTPFNRASFWVPSPETAEVIETTRVHTPEALKRETVQSIETQILTKTWERAAGSPTHPCQGHVLLLLHETQQPLIRELEKVPGIHQVVAVFVSSQAGAKANGRMIFNPDDPVAGEWLGKTLFQRHGQLDTWIDISDCEDSDSSLGMKGLGRIKLAQAFLNSQPESPITLFQVTRGLIPFENSQPQMLGATVSGFFKMLGTEYQRVTSRLIDVEPDTLLKDFAKIITEELAWDSPENEICYRQGVRYRAALTRIGFEEQLRDIQNLRTTSFDPNRVIVISGGTRGIGAALAKHLANMGARYLVLMGREQLPPQQDWEHLKPENLSESVQAKIELAQSLKARGTKVALYSGSLTNMSRLDAFFKEIRKNFAPIGGVLHCAGLSRANHPAFVKKGAEEIQTIFEPKCDGLVNLQKVFAEDQLEFFMLFSSVSALIPQLAVGVSDYAAANTFLDCFAQNLRSQFNQPFQAVAWPNWKDVGMGEMKSARYQSTGLQTLTTEEGLYLFERALVLKKHAYLVPCRLDVNRYNMRQWLDHAKPKKRQTVAKPTVPEVNTLEMLKSQANKANQEASILAYLKDLFSKNLKISQEQLDEDLLLGELGVDSILLADLIQGMEAWLDTKLEPTVFMEHSSLRKLKRFVRKHYPQAGLAKSPENQAIPSQAALENQNQAPAEVPDQVTSLGVPESIAMSEPLTKPRSSIRSDQHATSGHLAPIAIIGMACHFPGAPNIDTYWQNLKTGTCSIREVPASRWSISQHYAPTHQKGKTYSKWGGFLEDIELFDPAFFRLNAKDAAAIDPLVRQMLEVSVETIAHAGYSLKDISDRALGVFVGSRMADYNHRLPELAKNSIIGMGQNFIGAHISHFLNTTGPNLVLDSACSSSLLSVHLACQSLRQGDSEMALAGGVDILLDEKPYLTLSQGRALSPDGRCHTFDERANGFVPGEGAGAVLLKRLDQALADGDQVYGILAGSAVNNDGRTMGITTPNPEAQVDVIRQALARAKLQADNMSYIEAHGTGTMIGDPIELKALTKVFFESTQRKGFCGVGSVKTNFGHLLSAAGIASVIKTVLALHHGQLPPTLHCKNPNPRFKFDQSPFYPVTQATPWTSETLRFAGISGFGFGGTNVHLVVGEAPIPQGYQPKRQPLPAIHYQKQRHWYEPHGGKPRWQQEEAVLQNLSLFSDLQLEDKTAPHLFADLNLSEPC